MFTNVFGNNFKSPVKGPRPYSLVVVDEYSRYPFVFPCKNMTSETVCNCYLLCTDVWDFQISFIVTEERHLLVMK